MRRHHRSTQQRYPRAPERGHQMRVLLVLTVVVSMFLQGGWPAPQAAAQIPAGCQFILGFATLRDLIGAGIVGDCLADQQFVPNGDAQQPTTGGLLVWRKADNWTAFTDGYWTWLNGP